MIKNELEDRLIDFAVSAIAIIKSLNQTFASQHLAKQLLRSSTSVALNYSEARSGQSGKDFVHKLQICLKECRETMTCLTIIERANLNHSDSDMGNLIDECNQLISILVSSIKTKKRNLILKPKEE